MAVRTIAPSLPKVNGNSFSLMSGVGLDISSRHFAPDQSPFGFCEEMKLHSVQLLPIYQTGRFICVDALCSVSQESWERKERLSIISFVHCSCMICFKIKVFPPFSVI